MDRRNVAEERLGIRQRLFNFLVEGFCLCKPEPKILDRRSSSQQQEAPLPPGREEDMQTRVPVIFYKDGRLGVASPVEVPVEHQETKGKAAGATESTGIAPPLNEATETVTIEVESEKKSSNINLMADNYIKTVREKRVKSLESVQEKKNPPAPEGGN